MGLAGTQVGTQVGGQAGSQVGGQAGSPYHPAEVRGGMSSSLSSCSEPEYPTRSSCGSYPPLG